MKADLLIKNGTVVSPRRSFKANIYVQGERIAAITDPSLCRGDLSNVSKVIDAEKLFIIPGLVDPHVHMMDPGYPEREDFTSGTRAAAFGGVTTVMEHHRTVPPVYSARELEEKISYLGSRSVVDFCLMGGGTPDNVANIEEMWQQGAVSFKMFTCSLHQQPAMDAFALWEMFGEIKRIGAMVLIHCEDDSLTTLGEKFLKEKKRFDYLSHYEWRSVLAEEVAVDMVINAARETGAKVVIAHVSSPHLLEKISRVRRRGYPIYAESCPHYLNLSTEDLALKGPWVKFAPSVRKPETVSAMWQSLNQGLITYLGSDHCPFPRSEKAMGAANIWEAPNGIPGVETGLRVMLTAVNEGKTTLNRVVEVMCENPARVYGIFPRKGVIGVGSDADLLIVDMQQKDVLSNDKIVSRCGWTPFDGKEVQGAPRYVFLRGQALVEDGLLIGEAGMGKFITRMGKGR
ncbi:MAG: dihydroorotase [Dethiobacteria bacterium]|jgi:allantoinase